MAESVAGAHANGYRSAELCQIVERDTHAYQPKTRAVFSRPPTIVKQRSRGSSAICRIHAQFYSKVSTSIPFVGYNAANLYHSLHNTDNLSIPASDICGSSPLEIRISVNWTEDALHHYRPKRNFSTEQGRLVTSVSLRCLAPANQ